MVDQVKKGTNYCHSCKHMVKQSRSDGSRSWMRYDCNTPEMIEIIHRSSGPVKTHKIGDSLDYYNENYDCEFYEHGEPSIILKEQYSWLKNIISLIIGG